jgi:hypothetical protein
MVDAGFVDPDLVSFGDPWAESSRDAPTATETEVGKAVTVAGACFWDYWGFLEATMLLALKRCKRKDPIILDGFAALFAGK